MMSGDVIPRAWKPKGAFPGSAIKEDEEVGSIQGTTKSQQAILTLSHYHLDISSQEDRVDLTKGD